MSLKNKMKELWVKWKVKINRVWKLSYIKKETSIYKWSRNGDKVMGCNKEFHTMKLWNIWALEYSKRTE